MSPEATRPPSVPEGRDELEAESGSTRIEPHAADTTVVLAIPARACTRFWVRRLRLLLMAHRGDVGIIVRIEGKDPRTLRLAVRTSVDAVDALERFLAPVGGSVRVEEVE
jgi:hypothetical protein